MNPTCIITSDIHVPQDRNYSPVCRTDNYWETFNRKIDFILNIQNRYKVPILDAGDFNNKPRLSPFVESVIIEKFRDIPLITIPGNHEIPSHNLNYLENSSLSVFRTAMERFTILNLSSIILKGKKVQIHGFPYGSIIQYRLGKNYRHVALCHTMVYKDNAILFLRKMRGMDLVITGHNHMSFMVKYKNRILLNPGSIMRNSADLINEQPKVFLWDSDNQMIKAIDIPINHGSVTDRYLRKEDRTEQRMEAFIERLNNTKKGGINFQKNMEKFLRDNKVKSSVRSIITEVLYG